MPWSSLCIAIFEMESSVQVSMFTLNFSQSILAHLFEIKTTKEQSINKWSAIPTVFHFGTLGGDGGGNITNTQMHFSATNNDLVQH